MGNKSQVAYIIVFLLTVTFFEFSIMYSLVMTFKSMGLILFANLIAFLYLCYEYKEAK